MGRRLVFSANKSDFRVDTFCAGGPGGQHQNTTETGVRITHIESGLSAESREYKSQRQNKKSAFRKLCDLLVDHYVIDQEHETYDVVIRTYHEPDNRVKDHASGVQMRYKDIVGKGKLAPMIEARREQLMGQGDE